jgi:hypothetical protein
MSVEHTQGKLRVVGGDQVISEVDYEKAIADGLDHEDACGEALVVETAGNNANAERMAHCWNCHDELVEALERARDHVIMAGVKQVDNEEALTQIRAVLAQAQPAQESQKKAK